MPMPRDYDFTGKTLNQIIYDVLTETTFSLKESLDSIMIRYRYVFSNAAFYTLEDFRSRVDQGTFDKEYSLQINGYPIVIFVANSPTSEWDKLQSLLHHKDELLRSGFLAKTDEQNTYREHTIIRSVLDYKLAEEAKKDILDSYYVTLKGHLGRTA